MPRSRLLPLACLLIALSAAGTATASREALEVDIDATQLPRKLLDATVRIPVPAALRGGSMSLWYPKWVPGSHGPSGPVENIAGLVVRDRSGQRLTWARHPGEVYRLEVEVPAGVDQVVIEVRYITDQPSVTSRGLDSFGSELIGFISPNTVLLYRDDQPAPTTPVRARLRLPDGWRAATALRPAGPTSEDGWIPYREVSLETFVDSPILAGAFLRSYDLVQAELAGRTPPHQLHLFSESEAVLGLDELVLDRFRRMVSESTLLFGSHPFDSFDVLLATSDVLERNGLEHLNSSFNVIGLRALEDDTSLKGWERMLVPHEYVHAWCGKYRRPAGMITGDFHSPKDTRLLWVYEGLTTYLGTLLEVRSGLMPEAELAWQVRESLRRHRLQQGRAWRPLEDTGSAAYVLRGGSARWGHLRRSQDYYGEGSLIWMEADARIRNLTDGAASLDDFVRAFFRHAKGMPVPHGYGWDDIVAALDAVVSDDWDSFLRDRVAMPSDRLRLELAAELGYRVQYDSREPERPDSVAPSRYEGVVATDSIGLTVDEDGTVRDVILGTAADAAGLGPGMMILGINDYVWSPHRLEDAIAESVSTPTIELLMVSGDKLVSRTLEYDGGPRHLVLVRNEDAVDRLAEIARPLGSYPAAP